MSAGSTQVIMAVNAVEVTPYFITFYLRQEQNWQFSVKVLKEMWVVPWNKGKTAKQVQKSPDRDDALYCPSYFQICTALLADGYIEI